MNTNMWLHAATQANIETLRRRGHRIVDPEEGELACGMVGPGRLAEPEHIALAVDAEIARRSDLEGETVLITAGPTQEPLDPVRYISNRSSGKMGYALAEAAAARGAHVILISGPVHLAPPRGCTVIPVHTAREMRDQVFEHLRAATIIVKAAAVADFHLAKVPSQKMKKTAARLSLELDPTPDILAELGRKKGDRAAGGLRRRDRKSAAGNPPQAGSQELRYGGRQPGGRAKTEPSNPTRTKYCWRSATANSSPCRALRSAKSPTAFSTRFCNCACIFTPPMDADTLRQYLEYYQDLGIKTLYRRARGTAC